MNDMSGKDLELRRRAMDVTASDLAAAAGYKSTSSITQIEQRAKVPAKIATRYIVALATFGAIPNITFEKVA